MSNDEVSVVVVDDVMDVADTLAMQLKMAGYSVHTAYSAADAILAIEQNHPHCVLLDIDMPGIDGYELVTLLRHRFKNELVLIAVSGWDDEQARVTETFSMVDHYFRKPVDTRALRKVLPSLSNFGQSL
jgi:DNA-binding response OmpR family regulator